MKKILTIIACSFIVQYTYAQISNDPALLVRNRGGMSGYIKTYQPDPEIEGDFLYFKETVPVMLYLKDGKGTYKIENANIDLIDQSVLVDIRNNMYAINYAKIDSAIFDNVKVMDYQFNSEAFNTSTMALVLARYERATLLKTIDITLIKPTYNEALDTGSRNYTLKHKIKYFIDLQEKGVLDLTKKLKSFKGTAYYNEVKAFVKQYGTDFTSDKDVLKLSEYVASLN